MTDLQEGCAALLLAGGASRRMGRDKASLPWHGGTLASHVAGVLSQVCAPVLVVAAPAQTLPELPAGVEVVRDAHAGEGPLEGLATGLAALADRATCAFACAVDVPFLQPALVRAVCDALGDADAAVPHAGGFAQPLCACYRVVLASRARDLLSAGERRAAALAPPGTTRVLSEDELRRHDPELASFTALHDTASYAAALAGDTLAAPWAASTARRASSPRRS